MKSKYFWWAFQSERFSVSLEVFHSTECILVMLFFEILTFCPGKMRFGGLCWLISRCWQIFSFVWSKIMWKITLKHLQLHFFLSVRIFLPLFYHFFFSNSHVPPTTPTPTLKCQPTCPSSSYPLIPGQVSVIFELTSERLLAGHGWWLCVSVCVCVCVYCIQLRSSAILSFPTPLFDLRGHYF